MLTIEALINSLNTEPCHAFWGECVSWAEEAGAEGETQLREHLAAGGEPRDALSILSAINMQCEDEIEIDIPEPVQKTQEDGSIRCVTPMPAVTQFFPDRFSHLESLFAELRDQLL